MTLVDTSVWIDHFRRPNATLAQLLTNDEVCTHRFVIGELACGSIPDRERTLARLELLPSLGTASDNEVRGLIEIHRLWGSGIGWVDVHLLTTAAIAKCKLLTVDGKLHQAAARLGIAYPVQ
ncbi:MAG TPA: PIN domain-containing protein [Bryobacteraceae bacterium]|jgi:hypothetical protein